MKDVKKIKGKLENFQYKYVYKSHLKELHSQPLFGVSMNPYINNNQSIFATVGGNQTSIYTCHRSGQMEKLMTIVDDDTQENYYCCEWSYDKESHNSIIAIAGYKGVIRVVSLEAPLQSRHLLSHGYAINQLKFHPKNPELLFSASKDQSLRLWNVTTMVLIAIFSGVDGHRDEVISLDIHASGDFIVSSGMDHAIKIWNLNTQELLKAIEESLNYISFEKGGNKSFPTVICHIPSFSTRDIHKNYVDSVLWYGDLIFSKTCENCVSCWTVGDINFYEQKMKGNNAEDQEESLIVRHLSPHNCSHSKSIKLFDLPIVECDLWYMRMGIDLSRKILGLGNCNGKLFVWELGKGDDSATIKPQIIKHNACKSIIRQVSFGPNYLNLPSQEESADIKDDKKFNDYESTLIFVCDDSTIWRYDIKLN